jgi:nitrite reductase/ring-hydroxylating ferredoxin subunit
MSANETSPPNHVVCRRTAIRTGSLFACGLLLAIAQACESEELGPRPPAMNENRESVRIDVTAYPELSAIGGSVVMLVQGLNGDSPVVLIRVSEVRMRLFSAICTHGGNVVDPPEPGASTIRCPRHGEEYDIVTGSPRRGLGSRALDEFDAVLSDDGRALDVSTTPR